VPFPQCTALLKEKSDLAARVQALEAEAGALRSGAGASAAASRAHDAETGSLKSAVADLHAQLEATKVRAPRARGRQPVCVQSRIEAPESSSPPTTTTTTIADCRRSS
jgi:hypothetical protein